MYNGHVSMISTTQLARQVDWLEEIEASRLACKAVGLPADYGAPAVIAEMGERVHEALVFMDWAEDTLEMYPDDYSDWVEETQSLRHGG